MSQNYIFKKLKQRFTETKVLRKMRVNRYNNGDELVYKIEDFENKQGKITIKIEKFVGGGFAGQVYKVKLIEAEHDFSGLEIDNFYAIKILIPPSNFSKIFRDFIFWVAFQAPFQLQVNPAASRAGALWQKFIRRAAKINFGNENAVVDIHATFIDENLGSCGEISEWIEGRTWRLEVDENLDQLKLWSKKKNFDSQKLGSTEYREKSIFMHDFVKLLHQIGGHEFARQYEWSTCKSQPNCLKRTDKTGELVAVDFRAGLALLPFLPMSPADFKLILKGILRLSFVQFDRGNLKTLKKFIERYPSEFEDMKNKFEELRKMEDIYRNSMPDISHNYFRGLYSKNLWHHLLSSAKIGWQIRNLISPNFKTKLDKNKFFTFILFIISFIPFLGKYIIKFLGNSDWRKHYLKIIYNWKYLAKSFKAIAAEKAIIWLQNERIEADNALKIVNSNFTFLRYFIFSFLPIGLHKFLTNSNYFKEKLWFIFIRPIRLYFDVNLRKKWLLEMVEDGKKKHILSDEDAEIIESKMNEPFIQKYLKSMAVHICTLPITQIVSVIVATIFAWTHPELPIEEKSLAVAGILVLFQIIPISPGSLTRGLYVLYLVIKERDFKNYNIAVFLGFFKYIGYLAFPIQMTYKYPAMARFMAGHWATDVVHIVPIFGERGALLEHWVFNLFYNKPLTIRRQMDERKQLRKSLQKRFWHIPVFIVLFAVILGICEKYLPNITNFKVRTFWYLTFTIPILLGIFTTAFGRGTPFGKRVILALCSGILLSIMHIFISLKLGFEDEIFVEFFWRFFIYSVFTTIGSLFAEIKIGKI
ncbi:MAG: hypothetical protein HN952_06635 [Candidatus Cloacimonetes bacterium]|nr:hypothetical protein [Candidatus Cloacimonadota bacterium]MBT6994612.1 hypothetical protein [Candidatus Cloacimonadota bacterium]